jgi:hypothetical protein
MIGMDRLEGAGSLPTRHSVAPTTRFTLAYSGRADPRGARASTLPPDTLAQQQARSALQPCALRVHHASGHREWLRDFVLGYQHQQSKAGTAQRQH